MSLLWVILLVSIEALGVLGLGVLLWRSNAANTAQQALLQQQIAAIHHQLALVGQATAPLSVAFQAILVKELTHYHTPRMDALMVKLGPPFLLTEEEETTLLHLLKEREADMGAAISTEERDAAHILPIIIKRARRDMKNLETIPPIYQLVSVPSPAIEELIQPADTGVREIQEPA